MLDDISLNLPVAGPSYTSHPLWKPADSRSTAPTFVPYQNNDDQSSVTSFLSCKPRHRRWSG